MEGLARMSDDRRFEEIGYKTNIAESSIGCSVCVGV